MVSLEVQMDRIRELAELVKTMSEEPDHAKFWKLQEEFETKRALFKLEVELNKEMMR